MKTTLSFDDWDTSASSSVSIGALVNVTGQPAIHNIDSRTIAAGSTMAAVDPEQKRVVNGQADINQLAPFKYPWAWSFFLNANRNHWTPLEISMAQDVHDYQHKLTPAERHVFEMCWLT